MVIEASRHKWLGWGDRSLVQVDFLYPLDATPPQVLTVSTEAEPR
ncbi:DUF3370 family protein [Nostoc sp. WHI]|nr:DUF3370 family protein [Nostoc sp. WHI]MBG1268424.1 DUF3370 family protein [Nostoc sp. WHI]